MSPFSQLGTGERLARESLRCVYLSLSLHPINQDTYDVNENRTNRAESQNRPVVLLRKFFSEYASGTCFARTGRWHLGYCKWQYTPTFRGFDSFRGFYLGSGDYYEHLGNAELATDRHQFGPGARADWKHRGKVPRGTRGYDFRTNNRVGWEARGRYSTVSALKQTSALYCTRELSSILRFNVSLLGDSDSVLREGGLEFRTSCPQSDGS